MLVDLRGTGHSQALDCRDLQAGRGPDELGVASCAQQLGDSFVSYRTSASADDVDDVRRALGFERIDLYGDSYGTYLAESYAFRHGETLDALVLDGAYPLHGESGWARVCGEPASGRWRSSVADLPAATGMPAPA